MAEGARPRTQEIWTMYPTMDSLIIIYASLGLAQTAHHYQLPFWLSKILIQHLKKYWTVEIQIKIFFFFKARIFLTPSWLECVFTFRAKRGVPVQLFILTALFTFAIIEMTEDLHRTVIFSDAFSSRWCLFFFFFASEAALKIDTFSARSGWVSASATQAQ